ncbi:MAG: cell division protein SepF [Candidatus Diapherotrites archaeon]|nr:cell division protein SepF [Candidatus Diapherotrites archaeon]
MGLLDAIFGRKREEIELDEFLASLEEGEEILEEAKMYVKPMQLLSQKDYDVVISELEKGNIVLLNIRPMASRNMMMVKEVVGKIKDYVLEHGGDIARITEYYVLVTPPGVKIVKRRSR